MPIYEYLCSNCGYAFEEMQSMKEEPLVICPSCKQNALKRLIGAGSGIIFKGSGFYITDYKKKNTSETKHKETKSVKKETKEVKDSKSSKESKESKPKETKKDKTDKK